MSLYGTDKEKTLFQPQETSWLDIAEECAEAGVGVHMFLFPSSFIDVASIGKRVLVSDMRFNSYYEFQGSLQLSQEEIFSIIHALYLNAITLY